MKLTKQNKGVILHSLVWAALMIASALLIGDAENTNQLIILMIGGWFISHQQLLNAAKNNDQDGSLSCMK